MTDTAKPRISPVNLLLKIMTEVILEKKNDEEITRITESMYSLLEVYLKDEYKDD